MSAIRKLMSMGFSALLGLVTGGLRLIPMRILLMLGAAVVALGFAYFTGVSHGREPYKLAAAVHKVVVKQVNRNQAEVKSRTAKLRKKTYAEFKDYGFVITDIDGDRVWNFTHK